MDIKAKQKEIEEENRAIADEINAIDARKRDLINQGVANNGKLDLIREILEKPKTEVKPVEPVEDEKKGGSD